MTVVRRLVCFAFASLLLVALSGQSALAQSRTFAPEQLSDQRRWESISKILRAVEPAYAASSNRHAATDDVKAMRLDRLLDWSGEAGALLLIPIQEPDNASGPVVRLGTPVLIGVGAHPFDAAVAGLFPGPRLAEMSDGMRYAPRLSRFVWARYEGSRIRYRHLSLPESQALRGAVTRFVADDLASTAYQRARTMRIVDGVTEHFNRQRDAAPLVAEVEDARLAYGRARTALDNGERARSNWRSWAVGSAAAFDLVEQYKSILTLSELRSQAQFLTIPALRNPIRQARTVPDLQLVLSNHRDDVRQRLATLDVPQLCREELRAYTAFFASLALEGELEGIVRTLLPEHSEVPCLEANP